MTDTAIGEVVLEEIDNRSLSDEDFAAVHAYGQMMRAEVAVSNWQASVETLRAYVDAS